MRKLSRRTTFDLPFTLALLCSSASLVAQTPQDTEAAADRPSLQAVRLAALPAIDGDVLGDAAWEGAPIASGLVQTQPFLGEASSQRTEVRIGFDDEALYVAVICYDDDPSKIIVSDSRRDASLSEMDSFQIIFDTYRDGQNGFVFGTNPAGIEYDAQVVRGGSGVFGGMGGPRFSGGTTAGMNLNWDAAWTVAAATTEIGWSAEMAIPFRTLRYGNEPSQTWGLNFQRNIRRVNEQAYWAPLAQNHALDRLTDAGTLEGIEPPPQRNLKLTPYVLSSARRPGTGPDDTEDDFEAGLDVKWSVTPSLTLDLTVNTDFAQVEVDEQQVNLDRVSLFFPEKRPFFLENAGIFAVGASATSQRASAQVDLFFSRRIGLGPAGEVVPIEFGGRLTGKVGKTNIGFIGMQTERLGDIQANQYGVARINHELANRSSLGAMVVTRQGTGALSSSDDENHTYVIDGQWGIGEHHTLNAFVAQTDTPGLEDNDRAYHLGYNLGKPKWRALARYLTAEENFNPEVGFLSRENFEQVGGFVMRVVRPEDWMGLQEIRPHVSYNAVWDDDGFKLSQFVHVDSHWEFRNSTEIHTGINFSEEGVRTPFEIVPGIVVPPGKYDHSEAQLVFFTNRGKPLSFSTRTFIGGFFGGDRVSTTNSLTARYGEAFTSQLSWTLNDVNLPVGDFEVNLGRLRLSYSLSPRTLIQALVQYNDLTDSISTNLRFSWLRDANTGLFVVYNEIDEFGFRDFLQRADRSLVVKYSYLFDVFGRR